MNLYEYQRSRSFIDLGPRSLRFNILKLFSLETARPVEAKFHVRPWDGGMKTYSNGPGHLTSVDAMPIYWSWSKVTQIQHFKTVSLETARPVEAKFHVRPWDGGMKTYSNGPGHLTSVDAMPIYC